MIDALTRSLTREGIFSFFLLFVLGTSGFEILIEFGNGETVDEMVDDLLRFGVGVGVLAVLLVERRALKRKLGDVGGELRSARGRLALVDAKTRELASQYRAVMQKQFDAWALTASEQDVVIAILKGLSFREIAELRDTREKTVRQQASSIYRKAGVGGRNELTAWFFEDMLDPPPAPN